MISTGNLRQLLHNNQRSLVFYYSGMVSILCGFFIFQILYHIFVTVLGYGAGVFSPEAIAIFRDGVRMLIAILVFAFHPKAWEKYLSHWGKMIVVFGILLVFSVVLSRFMFGKTVSELLIGVKYGLWYLCILISAGWMGYFLADKVKKVKKSDFFSFEFWQKVVAWGLVGTVVLGWIWQFAKLIFPERFLSIGYGKLDDYHFGLKPPLYYLTGYEGTLRWQGLFSGPNNYGYFLVVFLPLILQYFSFQGFSKLKSWEKQDWISVFVVLLWFVTLGATLSRAAMIGAGVVLFCVYFAQMRKYKKILISALIGIGVLLVGMSVLKWESTLGHIHQKLSGVLQVIHQPLGYGLGSSGPAVHHTGSFLPENFYLQLMLDLGTLGFLIWLGVMWIFFRMQRKAVSEAGFSEQKAEILQYFGPFQIGLLALLVMGLFLHVFEDSMVNYVFFGLYGLMLGGAQALTDTRGNEKGS